MKIFRTITVALAAVFLVAAPAYAGPKNDSRKKIEEENRRLQEKIVALLMELVRYSMEADVTDSLEIEMLEAYGESVERSRDSFDPIEYTTEVSDSLMNIWYAHQMAAYEVDFEGMDSVKFESNVPDEVYIERLKKMNSFITLPYNETVRKYIVLYSEKMPNKMSHMLGLCRYYMPIFEEIFDSYDLPLELKAMTIIESGMNPLAVSRAGAKGMWQIKYNTAKE